MALEWTMDPSELGRHLVEDHAKLCEAVALEVFDAAVKLTPAWTGSLRASWRIAVGAPDESITDGGSERNPLPPPSTPESLGELPDYPEIFVTNSQPYAELVEDGGPKNVPHHMLQNAIEATR